MCSGRVSKTGLCKVCCVQGRSARIFEEFGEADFGVWSWNEAAVAEIKKTSTSLTEHRRSERGRRKDSLTLNLASSLRAIAALSSVPAVPRGEPLASYHRNGTGVGAHPGLHHRVAVRDQLPGSPESRDNPQTVKCVLIRIRTRGSVINREGEIASRVKTKEKSRARFSGSRARADKVQVLLPFPTLYRVRQGEEEEANN